MEIQQIRTGLLVFCLSFYDFAGVILNLKKMILRKFPYQYSILKYHYIFKVYLALAGHVQKSMILVTPALIVDSVVAKTVVKKV